MSGVIITFYYKGESMYDPDWDRRPVVIPNVGDEIFLRNTYEDQYEKYWYTVVKRRWLNDRMIRIHLADNRWKIDN